MKKLTVLAAALSLLSFPAFADQQQQQEQQQQQQQQQPECDHGVGMHCSYFIGSSAKYVQVKATLTGANSSMVVGPVTFCLNHYGLIVDNSFIYSGHAKVGDTFDLEYKQCKDRYCSETIPLVNDKFVIEKADDGYTSTPPTATVQLNDQFGVSCGPARSDSVAAFKPN